MSKVIFKHGNWDTCKHVKKVMSLLIVTKESCPNHMVVSGMCATTKQVCSQCKKYEPTESKVLKK